MKGIARESRGDSNKRCHGGIGVASRLLLLPCELISSYLCFRSSMRNACVWQIIIRRRQALPRCLVLHRLPNSVTFSSQPRSNVSVQPRKVSGMSTVCAPPAGFCCLATSWCDLNRNLVCSLFPLSLQTFAITRQFDPIAAACQTTVSRSRSLTVSRVRLKSPLKSWSESRGCSETLAR